MVQMSVPSHCYLLADAQDELAKLLNEVEFNTPSIPVIPNVLAKPTSEVNVIKDSFLFDHLKSFGIQIISWFSKNKDILPNEGYDLL